MGTSGCESEVEDGWGAEAQRKVEACTQEVGQGERSKAAKWQEGQVQAARRTAIYNRGSCVDGSDGHGNSFRGSSHICSNTGSRVGNRSCHWYPSSTNGSSGSRHRGEEEAKAERGAEGMAHTGPRGASQGLENGRQRQAEEDKECQRKSDKEWEQKAEAMYASREYATQGMQDQLYSRKQFSAAKVKMYVKTDGKYVEESSVADTGAATEIMAECRLDAETMSTCKGDRARNLRNASGGSMGSRGEVMVAFKLGDCPLEFNHPFQAMTSDATPTILGCEFWDKYQASFCFATRKISLVVEGKMYTIDFTCGVQGTVCMVEEPLMALEDVWVQEGEPAMVKAAPVKETAQVGWSCGDVWLVEERESALEVNHMETWAESAAVAAESGGAHQQGAPEEQHKGPG